MIKSLVVSGCSFTMGGGLDNPNYHKYFESDVVYHNVQDGCYEWNQKAGTFGQHFLAKNNWGYHLHKLLKIPSENYKNFAIGGGGLFRTIQSMFSFLRNYEGNPSELQMIYQIPSAHRIELTQIHSGYNVFQSIMIEDGVNEEHRKAWIKYFQNDGVDWLRLLLELDKLNEICKLKGVPLILIDWNSEFGINTVRERIDELVQINTKPEHWPIQNYHIRKNLYKQITNRIYDNSEIDIKNIISDLPFFDVVDIIGNPKNKIHTIVNRNVEIIDHHLDPNGAKLLGNYIFEKKFKEN